MASGRTRIPSGAWTEVVASAPATSLSIKNEGGCPLLVSYDSSAPTSALAGFELADGDGDRPTNMSKVYARPLRDGDTGMLFWETV